MSTPTPSPNPAVSAPAEKAAPAEKPAAAKKLTLDRLPEGWDHPEFPWPRLRSMTMALNLRKPNSRPDAIAIITKALNPPADDPPPDATE